MTVTPFALVTLNGIVMTSPYINAAFSISRTESALLTVTLDGLSKAIYLSLPLYDTFTLYVVAFKFVKFTVMVWFADNSLVSLPNLTITVPFTSSGNVMDIVAFSPTLTSPATTSNV